MKTVNRGTFPLFSVLMSVYVKEIPSHLDKSLLSIENQTLLPKEIILVEDGELTSGLEKVIKRHENNKLINYIVIKLPKSKGLANALQIGTSYVSTNWIARMDSDDYSVPRRFEIQLRTIKENPQIAVLGGQVKEFANNIDNIVGYRHVPINEESIRNFLKWRNPFNHPTVILNKDALLEVGGYRDFGNLEDYYLWSRFIVNDYCVCNVEDYLTFMRVDEGMYSRRGNFNNIRYFCKLRNYLRENNLMSFSEELISNVVMSANIIIPSSLRKTLYQRILHK